MRNLKVFVFSIIALLMLSFQSSCTPPSSPPEAVDLSKNYDPIVTEKHVVHHKVVNRINDRNHRYNEYDSPLVVRNNTTIKKGITIKKVKVINTYNTKKDKIKKEDSYSYVVSDKEKKPPMRSNSSISTNYKTKEYKYQPYRQKSQQSYSARQKRPYKK